MSQDLDSLRLSINHIDDEILALLVQRADLMPLVAEAKRQASDNFKIFDPLRERMVLQRLLKSNSGRLKSSEVSAIFQSIIQACRHLQFNQNTAQSETTHLSIQGIKGSFSEQAAREFLHRYQITDYQIHYAVSSDQVLKDLHAEHSDYGVVAINNSQGGLVHETIAALTDYRYRIIDTLPISVRHCLLTLEAQSADIQCIYSHSQALKQCADYLKTHYPQAEQIAWADTAKAAADLARGELKPNSAVIAHRDCANFYGLKLMAEDIQDRKDNETLFFLLQAMV